MGRESAIQTQQVLLDLIYGRLEPVYLIYRTPCCLYIGAGTPNPRLMESPVVLYGDNLVYIHVCWSCSFFVGYSAAACPIGIKVDAWHGYEGLYTQNQVFDLAQPNSIDDIINWVECGVARNTDELELALGVPGATKRQNRV